MAPDYKFPRTHVREELPLPVWVECRESEDHEWEESTHILDVAPFGARLRIARPTEPGRLLHLTLPMPRRLRCYDHEQEQYCVWSLVRHCKPLPSTDDKPPHFEIGVAFIGKDCPATHETDPGQRYEIAAGLTETDLWRLAEGSSPDDPHLASSNQRNETRHDIADDVVIEIYGPDGRVYERETTKTENISRHGMAVLTNLNIARGRYIRVRSAQYRIAVIAAVRRLASVGDGRKRLHLEFVDQQWPPL